MAKARGRAIGPFANDTITNLYVNGMRRDMNLQQPSGLWTNRFTYDNAGRLATVTSRAGTFTYSLAGSGPASPLIRKIALPNSSYITNTYDGMARLTGTFLKNSSHTVLNKHEYVYNAGNQRTKHTRQDNSHVTYSYLTAIRVKSLYSTINQ